MKRTKVFGILFCIFLITALFTLTASAYQLSCDICIASQETPTGHCSYYCTGDEVQQCTCGGDYKIWCGETHQFNTLVQSVTGTDCKTKGTLTYACACGFTVTTNDGPAGGHAWDTGVLDTSTGKIKYTCTLCGSIKYDTPTSGGGEDPKDPDDPDPDDPDPDDPDPDNPDPDDPDDPEPDNPDPDNPDPDDPDDPYNPGTNPDGSGGTGSTCIHTYKASVIPPTCEERGYTWYECTKCDYAVQGDFKDPVPHEYEMYGQRDPTCTTSGMVYYTCKYCGVPPSADYGYLEPLGHNWSIYKSTIGDDKMITIVSHCDRCGNTKEEIMETVAGQAQNWLLTSIRGAAQGFIDIYETLANGIEVGGVTAGEVITGTLILIFIILMLAVIAKFLG